MTAFSCGRGTRPATWALVALVAAAIALLPWLATAHEARGDVCDVPVIGTACQAPAAIGDAIDATAGAVVDLSHWAIKQVKTAVSWSADHAGPVIETLAAAGVAVGAWVACSKVLKTLSSGAGGALAGAETEDAATPAGKLAGAAAAGLACKAVRSGGKLILKTGKKFLRSGGTLSKIAKLAAAATGLAAIVYGTQHAAAWVLTNLLDVDGRSGKDLGDGWVTQLRSDLNGIAGVLMVLLAVVGLGFAALRGSTVEARQILGGLVGAAVLVGLVGSLVYSMVVWTDAITNGLIHSHWGQRALGNWRDLGGAYAEAMPVKGHGASALLSSANPAGAANGTPMDDGSGAPWILRLLIAVLTVFFGALVWVELQIREGAALLLLIFCGLALATLASPRHRGLAHSFGMLVAGVIVAKLVIVTTLLVGGSLTQTAAAGNSGAGPIRGMLIGVGLIGLAAFAGWWTVSWFGLHGAGALGQVGATLRGGGVALLPGRDRGEPDRRDPRATINGGPPGPPESPDSVARHLARHAAARLPYDQSGATDVLGAPGAERVRQARERERRAGAESPPSVSQPAAHAPLTSPSATASERDDHSSADVDASRVSGEDPTRPASNVGDATAVLDSTRGRGADDADRGDAAPATAGADTPSAPPALGASPTPHPQPARVIGAGDDTASGPPSGSLDELARKMGFPADRLGSLIEDTFRPVDVEGVQRAFGEHAADVLEYLHRHRDEGGR